jgi:MraZ protein
MLRGSAQARIDDKGRLKVPTQFLRVLQERYTLEVFITSVEGQSALVFPLAVWEERELKLLNLAGADPIRRKYLERVSYFGQQGELDGQGRVVVPPVLRQSAAISGDVIVNGRLDHLEVWNHDRLLKRFAEQPFTDQDYQHLSERGV